MGQGSDIHAALHAVALDVCINNKRGTGVQKAREDIVHGTSVILDPALCLQTAATRIKRDANAPGERIAELSEERQIRESHGSDDKAGHAALEVGPGRGDVANASAKFHGNGEAGADILHNVPALRLSVEGAVEINHVQISGSLTFPGPGCCHGIG